MNPEAWVLQSVNWNAFVTLTLPQRLVEAGEARLGSVTLAYLRRVAEGQGIHFHRLLWVLRSELGEATRRLHFHCLLGGLQKDSKRERFRMKNTWESITGAMARVSRYNHSLPGVGYVLKAGVAYEASKFSRSADIVTVSKSILALRARSKVVLAD